MSPTNELQTDVCVCNTHLRGRFENSHRLILYTRLQLINCFSLTVYSDHGTNEHLNVSNYCDDTVTQSHKYL